MYLSVESCVQLGPHLTEWFRVKLGLRQGDPLSPILYIIFIDGLVREVKDSKIGVMLGDTLVNILLFADDIVLLASSRVGMQLLLDLVHAYSRKWRFLFNGIKSKVVVFTNKRAIQRECPLYLGIEELEEVCNFRYLGVEFKANLSWRLMKEKILKKAKSRFALIRKAVAEGLAADTCLKMWEMLIRPIIEYSVEVWGFTKWSQAESLQMEMGRLILGVGSKTANDAVRGELGLWSIESRIKLAILRWWGKIITMDKTRLCFKVYRFRRDHVKENRLSWCRFVRDLLIELNLGEVWISEDIGNLKSWCTLVKQRLAAKENADWKQRLLHQPKLRLYRLLKSDLGFESYLMKIPQRQLRREFTKFRCGTNDLRVETGRWSNEKVEDRTCCVCGGEEIEDEKHVLLECWVYSQLRMDMLRSIRTPTGDRYRLSEHQHDQQWMLLTLLGQNNIKDDGGCQIVQTAVARFLRKAMKKRREIIS